MSMRHVPTTETAIAQTCGGAHFMVATETTSRKVWICVRCQHAEPFFPEAPVPPVAAA